MIHIQTLKDYMRTHSIKINKSTIVSLKSKLLSKFATDTESDFDESYILKLGRNIKTDTLLFLQSDVSSTPIGICVIDLLQNSKSKRCYGIHLFAVYNKIRNGGIGTQCMSKLVEYLHSLSPTKMLELYMYSLPKSLNFYIRFGFVAIDD